MSKNLVLTGMMGVGKSTIGKSLANKLSFGFIDIDKIIEKKEGCSIDVIFNERQLELAFEGHLIHDHKRLGKNVGNLQSNDPKLLLPIPQSEMDSNSEMVQNPGY